MYSGEPTPKTTTSCCVFFSRLSRFLPHTMIVYLLSLMETSPRKSYSATQTPKAKCSFSSLLMSANGACVCFCSVIITYVDQLLYGVYLVLNTIINFKSTLVLVMDYAALLFKTRRANYQRFAKLVSQDFRETRAVSQRTKRRIAQQERQLSKPASVATVSITTCSDKSSISLTRALDVESSFKVKTNKSCTFIRAPQDFFFLPAHYHRVTM